MSTAALPLSANNCGFVGSVFGNAQDCDTFRHFNIVQGEGHCYGDFLIWDPVATGPNSTAGTGTQGDWIVLSDKVALACKAGLTGQQVYAVAIGVEAGNYLQSTGAIAIGFEAGNTLQSENAIAIGVSAGADNQSADAIAIGSYAGFTGQGVYSIAIGNGAGTEAQGDNNVAVGVSAGSNYQGNNAVAVGNSAGYEGQGVQAVAIGNGAGVVNQGEQAIALGNQAGFNTQGAYAIAIGSHAAQTQQNYAAIAVGSEAGKQSQGSNAIALGENAGNLNQQVNAIAIGQSAGTDTQGTGSIAIGLYAGEVNQGVNSIAIGNDAGQSNQHNNTIIVNASGSVLDSVTTGSCYIAPIREATGPKALIYEPSTKEVRFGDYLPPGVVLPFAGGVAPYGFLLCDGTAYSTGDFPVLFSLIGYAYGGGAGSFAVPNMKGRVAVGLDAAQTEFDALGEVGGAKTHTLTINEMPSHNHSYFNQPNSHEVAVSLTTTGTADDVNVNQTTGDTGGGLPHNNLQPYLVMNYIIKF